MKQTPELWSSLEFDGSKQEKLSRREESIKRFEEWDKKKGEAQGETKLKLDKAALDRQMQLEARERKVLGDKKEEEKRYVEERLYEDIDQIEMLDRKLEEGCDPKLIQQEAEKIAKESVFRSDPSRKEEKKDVKQKKKQQEHRFRQFNDPSKDIFDDSD